MRFIARAFTPRLRIRPLYSCASKWSRSRAQEERLDETVVPI